MVSTKKCAFNYSTMRADEMRLAIVWVSVFFLLLLRLLFLPLLFLAVIFGCFVSKYIHRMEKPNAVVRNTIKILLA